MVSFIGYIALTKSPLTTFFILLFAPEINLFGTTFHRQNRKAKTQSEIAEKSAIEQEALNQHDDLTYTIQNASKFVFSI